MPNWPWPHETRLQRRTHVANMYRDALWEHAPHICYDLDRLMDDCGQHWITGNRPRHLDPGEPMTAKEIADWTDTRINNVTNLIAARKITPVGRKNGRKTYWLRDFEATPQHVAIRQQTTCL